jgi:PAS domain S-box-containing protein
MATPAIAARQLQYPLTLVSVPLSGYTTHRLLRASSSARVYEAERKRDGRRVIAKVFALTDDAVETRVMHEFRVLQNLDIEGVVSVLGLERAGNEMVLLLDHVAGRNLAQHAGGRPLAVDEFLRIASRLVAILAAVHGRRVVHRDIKPGNILIQEHTGAVFLADFGISVLLEDTHRRVYDPDVIAGTLPYLSPEQTGRTSREVDSRSDLYSLGVTFFELLTGTLPFVASTPLELIHAHLARRSSAPITLRPELPRALSDVVLKLLEKAPEHRYQSARGLLADLERIAADPESPTFELGRDDVSATLQLPHQLYGRAREQQALTDEVEAVVAGGRSRLLVVSGAAGTGKSALIRSVEIPLSRQAGMLAIGKYERGRDELPYAGFVQACSALLDQVLTESDERLGHWRTRLHDGLGSLANVVAELVPNLSLILGELEPSPPLELADGQARLHRALIRFMTVFARQAPLVLVLDDMQWADGGSLELLRALLLEDPEVPVLVIAVERTRERASGDDPPLAQLCSALSLEGRARRLELHPLAREDLEALLSDVFGRPRSELTELAELVARKTENNPLFVRQFLVHLSDLELVRVGPGGWSWSIPAIATASISGDVLDVMVAKLDHLPADSRELVRVAACIGVRFTIALLTGLVPLAPEAIAAALYELERAGLISGLNASRAIGSTPTYQFSHEQLRHAVLERLEPRQRTALHRAIGRRLLARRRNDGPLGERVFEIVDQLDQGFGDDDTPTPDERDELLALNVEAGERALGSGAWSSALRYFSNAVALLEDSTAELSFRARFGHAQALALAGRTSEAASAFDELLDWRLSLRQLGQLVARRIRILVMQGQAEAALAFGLANLSRCGVEFRREPARPRVMIEAMRAWRLARSVEFDDLLAQPPIDDDRTWALLDIIDALKIPAYLLDQRLYALLVAHHAYRTLREGFHPTGPQAITQLAFVATAFGHGQRAGRLAEDAIAVAQQRATTVAARTGAQRIARLFIAHHLRSFRSCTEPLPTFYREMIEVGDRLSAGFVGGIALILHMEAGTHLRDFVALGQSFCHENPTWGSNEGAANANTALRHAATLADAGGSGWLTSDAKEVAGCSRFIRMTIDIAELSGRTLLGEHDRAWALVEAVGEDYERVLFGHLFVPRFALFSAVLASDRFLENGPERGRMRSLVRARAATLTRWARRCPINYESMAAIVEGELAVIAGRSRAAELAYERARSLADDAGVPYLEGLACLRLAALAKREGRSTTSEGALRAAHAAFGRWGAWAVVARLEREYPELGRPGLASAGDPSSSSSSTPRLNETAAAIGFSSSMDLGTVLATLQAISEDLQLDEVVTRVLAAAIENAGADRGVLLLERADGMAVIATGDSAAAVELVAEPIRLAEAEQLLATGVVHYVLRTGTAIVVDELRDDLRFASDPYVLGSGVRSLLCMPIVKQSQRVGALVLENHLHGASFTPARLEVLRVLVGQAASALDNARLYAALGHSEAQWRSLVDGAPDVIVLLDPRGTIEFCNHGDRRALDGRGFEQLLEPDAVVSFREAFAAALAGSRPRELELRIAFPGTGKRWFMTRLAAIESDGKVQKLLAISTDISERKELELKLRQQQRLEAIGTLASGVAHEINNPVQAILNYTELIEDGITERDLVREFNSDIANAANRVAAIVRNLLAFARQERDHDMEPCEVRSLIEEPLSLILAVLRKDRIKLELEIAEGLPRICCRRQQIQQIFMNLVTNARDAINEQARARADGRYECITIRASSYTRDGAAWVRIAVEDRAGGIPEHIRARIFDPFFTTKAREQGTGLGLSVSHGIATEHGGELTLETEVGVGTTFILTLPACN